MINYHQIITEQIDPSRRLYQIYLTHVFNVTRKALSAARKLNLDQEQLELIEAGGMLHDIGIVRVNSAQIDCYGELPYLAHVIEGGKILRDYGLEECARIAERHSGVGITEQNIKDRNLPLPLTVNYLAESIPEQLISWADLFYTKKPANLWKEKSLEEIENNIQKHSGEAGLEIFATWQERFAN